MRVLTEVLEICLERAHGACLFLVIVVLYNYRISALSIKKALTINAKFHLCSWEQPSCIGGSWITKEQLSINLQTCETTFGNRFQSSLPPNENWPTGSNYKHVYKLFRDKTLFKKNKKKKIKETRRRKQTCCRVEAGVVWRVWGYLHLGLPDCQPVMHPLPC